MKVLWLCNIMLPFIAKSLGQKYMVKEGWLSGLADRLIKNKDDNNVTLAICFPTTCEVEEQGFTKGTARGVAYYMFKEDTVNPDIYDECIEESLKAIIEDYQPDIVHIFGTEFPHTLAMTRAWNNPDKTLIGIQGMCSEIAKVYMADLPVKTQNRKTFRDRLRKDSLQEQQQKFELRGKNEIEALKNVKHVTGRTDFDKAMTKQYAPNAKYHFMNETLREEFYTDSWNIDTMEPYSIFLSQGNYPIKGLHYVLEILPELVKEHEETVVYVAGDKITANSTIKDKIKISGYGKYLLDMIRKNHMENHVKFLGGLNSDKMCGQYLKSHVFVCPSAIENSPNSVGEAMLLGVPVVAANVGGVHNLLTNNVDGLLYEHDDLNGLKSAILKIFEDDKLALSFSTNSKQHARVTHDPETNYKRLMEIYDEINNGV